MSQLTTSVAEPIADIEDRLTPALLTERRKGERMNFLRYLQGPNAIEDCANDEFFVTTVSLAMGDYGVSRRAVAALLGVSEASISRWVAGRNLPHIYARPNVVRVVCAVLARELEGGSADVQPAAPPNPAELREG